MKKRYVLPALLLSSAFLTSPFTANLTHAYDTNQAAIAQVSKQKTSTALFVKEHVLEKQNASNADNAKKFLSKHQDRFGIKNPEQNLKTQKTIKDNLGMTHVRLKQMKNGIPVEGSEVIVHYDKDNQVTVVNGHFNSSVQDDTSLDTTPKISKAEALSTAKGSVQAPDSLESSPTADLVIYSFNGENHLAYKVNLNFMGEKPGNWFVFVDAKTGNVIDQYNAIMDLDQDHNMTGSGIGVLGEHRTLHISHENPPGKGGTVFELADTSHQGMDGIFTYDLKNQWAGSRELGDLFTDNDASWKDVYQRPAVDAHYNSEQVYNFYKKEFGRNSIDGNGMTIISRVHYGVDYNNAFWNGQVMTYGDGDGKFFIPLSAGLDVAGHEMTHGVTTHSAGLLYRNQSGALNEAFSDIFGTLIDSDDWEVGEDVMAPEAKASGRTSLRSLSDPSKYPVGEDYAPYGNGSGMYPSNMSEYYNLPLNLDNGGVHINSSIINHAAYLTGVQIGKEKLGQIYYRALTVYLTPTSNFSDAKQALIQSAVDLYGEGSPEALATEDGLNQVGIQ